MTPQDLVNEALTATGAAPRAATAAEMWLAEQVLIASNGASSGYLRANPPLVVPAKRKAVEPVQ